MIPGCLTTARVGLAAGVALLMDVAAAVEFRQKWN
jgi:hypothetical protein